MAASNLWAFDFDAALRAVSDANAGLAARVRRALDARGRVPGRLLTDEDVDRARRFAELLAQTQEGCRRARLDDTKPLRGFVSRVEGFFKDMEGELAEARAEVMARLTEAGRRRARALPRPPASAPIIHGAVSGEVFATVLPRLAPPAPQEGTALAAIPMAWGVETVNRDTLDLEALRPHLTDAALLSAARAHLKANGPHALRGAIYAERAVP